MNYEYSIIYYSIIQREVLSISPERLSNLGGILSKPVAFFNINILRRYWASSVLVGSKVKNIGLEFFLLSGVFV